MVAGIKRASAPQSCSGRHVSAVYPLTQGNDRQRTPPRRLLGLVAALLLAAACGPPSEPIASAAAPAEPAQAAQTSPAPAEQSAEPGAGPSITLASSPAMRPTGTPVVAPAAAPAILAAEVATKTLVSRARAELAIQVSTGAQAPVLFTRFDTSPAFASGAFEGTRLEGDIVSLAPDQTRGTWTSSLVEPGFPFTRLVASWNARTPAGSWLQIEVQATTVTGQITDWYTLGIWAEDDSLVQRTSVNGQHDASASVATDTLLARDQPFAGYRLRVTLQRALIETPTPTLRLIGAAVSESNTVEAGGSAPAGPMEPIELPVPALSQEIHAGHFPQWGGGGEVWCSPTSTQMVLEYWGRGPTADELGWVGQGHPNPSVDFAARATYDAAYRGTGNWSFNTAYAARYGLEAFVTQLRSLAEAELFIRAGIPLVASIKSGPGELDGFLFAGGTSGHLVVIVGFDGSGNPVVNDPAAWTNAAVRRIYDRAQFEQPSQGLSQPIEEQRRNGAERLAAGEWSKTLSVGVADHGGDIVGQTAEDAPVVLGDHLHVLKAVMRRAEQVEPDHETIREALQNGPPGRLELAIRTDQDRRGADPGGARREVGIEIGVALHQLGHHTGRTVAGVCPDEHRLRRGGKSALQLGREGPFLMDGHGHAVLAGNAIGRYEPRLIGRHVRRRRRGEAALRAEPEGRVAQDDLAQATDDADGQHLAQALGVHVGSVRVQGVEVPLAEKRHDPVRILAGGVGGEVPRVAEQPDPIDAGRSVQLYQAVIIRELVPVDVAVRVDQSPAVTERLGAGRSGKLSGRVDSGGQRQKAAPIHEHPPRAINTHLAVRYLMFQPPASRRQNATVRPRDVSFYLLLTAIQPPLARSNRWCLPSPRVEGPEISGGGRLGSLRPVGAAID